MSDLFNQKNAGVVANQTHKNVEYIDWDNDLKDLAIRQAHFWLLASVDGEGKSKAVATKHREFKCIEMLPDKTFFNLPATALTAANITTANGISQLVIPTSVNARGLNGLIKDKVLLGTDVLNARHVWFRVMENPSVSGSNHVIPLRMIVVNYDANGVPVGTPDVERNVVFGDFAGMVGGTLRMLYVSKPEGGSDFNPVYREVDDLWNTVTKIVAHTLITDMKAADDWRLNVSPRDFQMTKEIIEFVRSIERAFLHGVPFNGTYRNVNTGAHTPSQPHNIVGDLQGTRGLLMFNNIQRYRTGRPVFWMGSGDNGGNARLARDFTYMDFVRICEHQVMMHNLKESLTGWCNRAWLTHMIDMVQRSNNTLHLDIQGKKDNYGLKIRELNTPHCDVVLRTNAALDEAYGSDPVCLICDMDKITTRYLANHGENLSMKVEYGVQNDNDDFYLDKVSGVYGVQVDNPTCHTFVHLAS